MPIPLALIGAAKATGGFIAANWKPLAIILVIGLGYWKYKHMVNQIKDLKAETVELAFQRDEYKRDNEQLNKIASANRESVLAIKGLADNFDGRMDALGHSLGIQTKNINNRLDAIRNSPTPTTCKGAVDFILENAPYLRSPPK